MTRRMGNQFLSTPSQSLRNYYCLPGRLVTLVLSTPSGWSQAWGAPRDAVKALFKFVQKVTAMWSMRV